MSICLKNYNYSNLENLIERHLDWNWNIDHLSENPSITPEFIESHPEGLPCGKWNILYLSSNPSITPQFLDSHSADLPTGNAIEPSVLCEYMYNLSKNPSIKPKFVESHLDWEWNMNSLSKNPSITPEFVESHQDWNWNMYFCLKIHP
jgi:hypothetical protein